MEFWLAGALAVGFTLLGTAVYAGEPGAVTPVLVIHGGALSRPREKLPEGREEAYRAGLAEALRAGYAVLDRDGSSLDSAEAAVRVLEDSPIFNAGRGAVFTHDGRNELDAAIMDGATRRAGSVAGVTRTRHPIAVARAVLEKSPHVLLIAEGADRFAREMGLEQVSPVYFWTADRWKQLQEELAAEQTPGRASAERSQWHEASFGTVGAAALDRHGRLAAATSTGGTSNKRPGRVGDSPVIGAGTWADESCAISATGHGEVFIRYAVAHDVACRLRYGGHSLAEAAEQAIRQLPAEKNGAGGLIALDRQGHVAMPYNTRGMLRGTMSGGKMIVAIYDK